MRRWQCHATGVSSQASCKLRVRPTERSPVQRGDFEANFGFAHARSQANPGQWHDWVGPTPREPHGVFATIRRYVTCSLCGYEVCISFAAAHLSQRHRRN